MSDGPGSGEDNLGGHPQAHTATPLPWDRDRLSRWQGRRG